MCLIVYDQKRCIAADLVIQIRILTDGLIFAPGDSIPHKQIRITSATDVVYILAHSVNDRMSVLLLSL